MTCKSCNKGSNPLNIIDNDFQANPSVREGDIFTVIVPVHNGSWIVGDFGRVCLYEGSELVMNSGSFFLGAGETVNIQLRGYMPNRDLYLKASLVEEDESQLFTMCQDAYDFVIKLGTETVPPDKPPVPPVEEKDWTDYLMPLGLILVGGYVVGEFVKSR